MSLKPTDWFPAFRHFCVSHFSLKLNHTEAQWSRGHFKTLPKKDSYWALGALAQGLRWGWSLHPS